MSTTELTQMMAAVAAKGKTLAEAADAGPKEIAYLGKAAEALIGPLDVQRAREVIAEGIAQINAASAAAQQGIDSVSKVEAASFLDGGTNATPAFDSLGRIASITDTFVGAERTVAITYTSETATTVSSVAVTYGGSTTTYTYQYDTQGRLISGATMGEILAHTMSRLRSEDPVGSTIQMLDGVTPDARYLPMDGGIKLRADYPALETLFPPIVNGPLPDAYEYRVRAAEPDTALPTSFQIYDIQSDSTGRYIVACTSGSSTYANSSSIMYSRDFGATWQHLIFEDQTVRMRDSNNTARKYSTMSSVAFIGATAIVCVQSTGFLFLNMAADPVTVTPYSASTGVSSLYPPSGNCLTALDGRVIYSPPGDHFNSSYAYGLSVFGTAANGALSNFTASQFSESLSGSSDELYLGYGSKPSLLNGKIWMPARWRKSNTYHTGIISWDPATSGWEMFTLEANNTTVFYGAGTSKASFLNNFPNADNSTPAKRSGAHYSTDEWQTWQPVPLMTGNSFDFFKNPNIDEVVFRDTSTQRFFVTADDKITVEPLDMSLAYTAGCERITAFHRTVTGTVIIGDNRGQIFVGDSSFDSALQFRVPKVSGTYIKAKY